MPDAARTFIVTSPLMQGNDIRDWQEWLNGQMGLWDVDYRLEPDGTYGAVTRSLTASVCHGLGLASAMRAMKDGVTPRLRTKLRNKRLTPAEVKRHNERDPWLRDFREKHQRTDVSPPLALILEDSWGYHPPDHDGVDLICKPNAPLLAICKGKVVRADAGGWWSKAPSGDVGKGDGIIVLRSLVDVGPFKPGLNFCYGHAEQPKVRVGDVEAGQVIGSAGLARAWHAHFMVNGRTDAKGVGDRDPLPFVRFAKQHA